MSGKEQGKTDVEETDVLKLIGFDSPSRKQVDEKLPQDLFWDEHFNSDEDLLGFSDSDSSTSCPESFPNLGDENVPLNHEELKKFPNPKDIGTDNLHTEEKDVKIFESKIILVRGLNKTSSTDTIRNLAESKTNEDVLEIVRIGDKTSALIKFEKIIDFKNAKEKIESRSLDGAKLSVHKVPVGGELTSIQYDEGSEQATRDPGLPVPVPEPQLPSPKWSPTFAPPSRTWGSLRLQSDEFNSPIQEGTLEHHSQHEIAVAVDKDMMEFIATTGFLSELLELSRAGGFKIKYSSGDSIVYITPECGEVSAANKERGIKTVMDFTKKFKVMELDVDKNYWEAVITEISKLHNEIGKDKLLVKEQASSKEKVTIICREDDSKELKKTFMDVIGKTQSLEAKKTHVVDTIKIEKKSLRLLQLTGYKEELVSEYSDIDVDINETNSEVTIQGPEQQCCEAKAKIQQKVSTFCKTELFLRSKMFSAEELLEKTGSRATLLCYDDNIYAVFHVNNDSFFVTGINKSHAVQASNFLKSLITIKEITIEARFNSILSVIEDKLDVFCKNISQEFKVCVGRSSDFNVCIAGIKEDVLRAGNAINKFLDDNIRYNQSTYCSSDKEMRRYLFDHRKGELFKMENDYSVVIFTDEKEPEKVQIHGARLGCALALEAIKSLEDSVSMKKIKVQQPGLHKLVKSGKLDKLIRKAEHGHKCAIGKVKNNPQLQGSKDSNGAASYGLFSRASTADSKKCGNVTISWKPGSIVTEHVSIQVGSSIGKLFEMFVKFGGPAFPKKVNEPGDYVHVIKETGNLPCDHAILVSCCKWDGGKGEAEKNLRSIVRACLQQALNLNAASIAFPIIGTGGLGFPYDRASQIMLSEVIDVARQLEEASLKDICFVVFDQDTNLVNVFNQEFARAFDHASDTTSPEASGSSTFSPLQRFKSLQISKLGKPFGKKMNAFGYESVKVVNGDLTKEETDAIVNINATNLNMQKAGALSKAIAAAAGPTVQTECTQLGQQAAGSAVVTGAGELKAKHIIHMIPGEASVQHIQQCIEKCLETADEYKCQSISIPACGTGGLKMSAEDSAKAIFQALLKMHSYFKHLKNVKIVIFKSEMFSKFSKKWSELKTSVKGSKNVDEHKTTGSKKSKSVDERTTSRELSVHGGSKKSESVGERMTSIELIVYGKNKDVVEEAVADLTSGLTEACKTKTIEDKNISKLSEDQRKRLTETAYHLGVEIKFDDSNQRIEFRGTPEDIMEIYEQAWKEIQKVFHDKVIPLPEEWRPMPKKNGKEETVHLVSLSNSSAEYQKVLKMFQETRGTGHFLKLERIQNPHLYKQYIIRKEQMDKDNGGMENERQLFHGTAWRNVNDINTRGFNRIFRGSNVGIAYGEGVYFAKNASYSCRYASQDANKTRYMYVARVLVGRYVMGNPQMKVPPNDPKTGTPFDSTANKDGPDASIFAAFYDWQCYPEYLITFQ